MMRLNKYLAGCGLSSRRKCDELISSGKVAINGVTETRLGIQIDENNDRVEVAGKRLYYPSNLDYFILNKPKGYVTTASDEKGRKTVLDLVPGKNRLFPVGRLDKNTSGLLILTNDGELAYQITHPKFQIEKVYQVTLDREFTAADRKKLQAGLILEEGKTAPCKITFRNPQNKKQLQMTLHQGWKRQIRRMFAVLRYKVLDLKRIKVGCIELQGLKPGACRKMTMDEIKSLKQMVDRAHGN
ncbi:MAG: pseudouridine synthase [bacterium]